MADDEERDEAQARARRESIPAPQDDPAVVESAASEVGPFAAGEATEDAAPMGRGSEAATAAEQDPATSADDMAPSRPAFATARDPVLEDAFASSASQQPDPGFGHRTEPSPEPRSNALTALFGIVLLLLLASVGYLFYALQERGTELEPLVADLTRRLATLEARPAPEPVDLAPLTKRIEDSNQDVGSVKQTLAALQGRIDSVASKASSGDAALASGPAVDLEPQIQALEAKLTDFTHGLDEVRSAVANVPKPDFGPTEGKISDLDSRLSALQKAVEALPRIDLTPVTARLDAIDGRVKPIEAQVEAAAAPDRVAQTRAAPVAVTAESIRRAIDAGRPFPADVDALQRLGADGKLIEPLQALAANGAPTLADLRAELATLRDRMLVGSAPVPTGSYLDRLVTGATNLVRVRPLGSVVGDSPGAVVARLDAALGTDDLAAALAEWQKLPEPARNVSKGLADRMRLRLAAETAARTIAANAIAAMTVAKE